VVRRLRPPHFVVSAPLAVLSSLSSQHTCRTITTWPFNESKNYKISLQQQGKGDTGVMLLLHPLAAIRLSGSKPGHPRLLRSPPSLTSSALAPYIILVCCLLLASQSFCLPFPIRGPRSLLSSSAARITPRCQGPQQSHWLPSATTQQVAITRLLS
jgi:hypothetical protein